MSTAFRGETFTFHEPDGKELRLRGWGDQTYAVFETLDGYTVVEDPVSRFHHYAVVNADRSELLPSGAIAGRVDPAALGIPKHARVRPDAARASARAARGHGERKRRWEERREMRLQAVRAASSTGIALAPPSHETTGDFVGLCLLIAFPDVPAQIARAEVDRFCNLQGYSGFGNKGSVRDYFFEVSNGRLRYTNVVVEYHVAAHPRAYYTDESIPQPTRARELIREALTSLKATGFDFSRLTTDAGGYLRALNVFYAGPRVNNWSKGLWPHSFHLGVTFPLDAQRVAFDYQFTDMGSELALATFCHENGHMVCDFPDLYDYGYQSEGVGTYCLMCYGGSDPKNPVHVGGYLKYKAGWASKVTPIAPGMTATLPAAKNELFLHARHAQEYFVIENRPAVGRDASLPSEGLAIWHVDETGDNQNEQMTTALHYEASIEQADGKFELERNGNTGDAGDLFSATTKSSFGDATSPDSKWWDGTASGLELTAIGPAGATMTFKTPGGAPETITVASKPNVAIPDDVATGVRDVVRVDQDGVLVSIEVSVDVTHSYRGDLVVALAAPSGKTVVLHQREGGGADDLVKAYDLGSSAALQALVGEPIQGDWTLTVKDMAPADTGKLNRWSLAIRRGTSASVVLAETPGLRIPDNDPSGIERVLAATATGTVKEVAVDVDISHTYVGDLSVALVAPDGTSVKLHDRTGGTADNIVRKYDLASTPSLATLRGRAVKGDWRLKVSDLEGADIGKLNAWKVTILPGA